MMASFEGDIKKKIHPNMQKYENKVIIKQQWKKRAQYSLHLCEVSIYLTVSYKSWPR